MDSPVFTVKLPLVTRLSSGYKKSNDPDGLIASEPFGLPTSTIIHSIKKVPFWQAPHGCITVF